MGGSIATAGGLVFIAATTDSKLRAFDSRTGKELWMTRLDATGDAVPMTYRGRNGKQYVVIAAAGTNRFRMIANTADETADSLIAFALPDGPLPGPAPSPTPTDTRTTAAPTAPQARSDGLPEGDGKQAVVHMCTACHGPAVFSSMRMSRDGWEAEVDSMVGFGAVGTEEEIRTVIAYLAKHFGREPK